MIERIEGRDMWVVRWCGATVGRFLALAAVMAASLGAVLALDRAFAERTGRPTPDTQNDLTVAAAVEQIRAWSAADAAAYRWFALVDFGFPLLAALLLAVLAHRAIVLAAWPRIPQRVALVCLLPAAADYGENVAFLVASAADGAVGPVQVALACKAVKLAGIGIAAGLVGVLGLVALARRLVSRHAPAAPGTAAAARRPPAG